MDEQSKKSTAEKKRISRKAVTTPINEHGKLPPQAVDLEEAVLGAVMIENKAVNEVIDLLRPEMFYKESHQRIFSAVQQLFNKSEPIDMLTVANELKSTSELDIIGGPYFITQLTNKVASAANINFHARIIVQKYIQRELISISSDIIKDAYEDTTDVFELLDKAEQNLFGVSESNLRRGTEEMSSLIRLAKQQIEVAGESKDGLSGVPSGFNDLDRLTSGWQASDLVILAARPGMGKTAFVLSMARNMAVNFKRPIAMFSLEMSATQLVTRLIASESEIPQQKLRKGNLSESEWEQLNSKISTLTEAPIFIDDTPALSVFELRAKCRRLKQQHNIELVIIDYLQLMTSNVDGKGNREQEISRAVETRGGTKKPILSDLRESGAIEQDADMVLFIYRPSYYKLNEDEDGNAISEDYAELIVAKHRNGALEDIKLRFTDTFARFSDGIDMDDFSPDAGLSPNESYQAPKTMTFPSKMNDDNDDDEEEDTFIDNNPNDVPF
jgi:replicative DNA helicase